MEKWWRWEDRVNKTAKSFARPIFIIAVVDVVGEVLRLRELLEEMKSVSVYRY